MTLKVAMEAIKIAACRMMVRAKCCVVAMLNANRKSNKTRRYSIRAQKGFFAITTDISPAEKNNVADNPVIFLGQDAAGNSVHSRMSDANSTMR